VEWIHHISERWVTLLQTDAARRRVKHAWNCGVGIPLKIVPHFQKSGGQFGLGDALWANNYRRTFGHETRKLLLRLRKNYFNGSNYKYDFKSWSFAKPAKWQYRFKTIWFHVFHGISHAAVATRLKKNLPELRRELRQL